MENRDVKLISKWSTPQSGVFTISDLSVLFSNTTIANLYKKINQLVEENILIKVMRGLYATPNAELVNISSRICIDSYISCGHVLAQNLIIGSVPAKKIQAIKVGAPRTYQCKLGTIEHLSINPKLYFGFVKINGVNFALPEKALLDASYFYFKGRTFSFDLDTDINLDLLNVELVNKYLAEYDKRFVTFFKKTWKI